MSKLIKAPFPWFGGKSRVAHLVWERFGNVPNYVEPFAGSLAVLLARPHAARNETVNDKDCYLANFWRALKCDPYIVADYADWPVNEADLHARHSWLVNQADFSDRMKSDPDYFDAKIAGWWVWGLSQWIGSGWCQKPEWRGRHSCERAPRGVHRKLPSIGRGDVRGVIAKRPQLKRGGNGTAAANFAARMPQQMPDVSASGRGVFSGYSGELHEYMLALATRLRRVRVCCGEWDRILGPSPTTCIGVTGVFLDPPYAADRCSLYNEEDFRISEDVRLWAIQHGDNPDLRIALCGYEGEHDLPGWTRVAWKANGGYGNQSGETRGRQNARKERIWFSPHCLRATLFETEDAPCA